MEASSVVLSACERFVYKLTVASGIAAWRRAGALNALGQADQSACGKSGENSPHTTDRGAGALECGGWSPL